MNETIGCIGLGNLGLPLARNLLKAGYALRVYNRTASKAEPLVAQGAQQVSRPVDAVTSGGIVVTILWGDASVESIVTSEGFLEQLGPGGIHLAMSTISPEMTKKLAAMHAQHGSVSVEAPIFGGSEAAVAQRLWIPFAGPLYQGHGKRIVEDTQAAPFRQRKIPLKDVTLFTKTAQQVELSTPSAHLLSDLLRSDEARA